MKQKITHIFKLALYALGLGAATTAQAAYIPVAVTGYNADVVANGTGTATGSSTIGIDAGGYVYMAQDFNPTGTSYLPNNGLISSAATAGVTFQMAAFTGNNSLRVPAMGTGQGTGTGSLTFTTPQSAGEVFLLATSGSGVAIADITVTFTDASTQVFSSQSISDWYGGSGYAVLGLGRVQRGVDNRENNASDPRLYQLRLTIAGANFSKQIQSIGFAKTSTTGVLNVMGVSINSVCSGTPAAGVPAATTATACTNNSFTLTLAGSASGSGISYQWQSSPAGANTFAAIAGATTVPYTVASLTAATDYRLQVTCTAGSTPALSAPVSITPMPFTQCYCTPTYLSGGNSDIITSVTVGTFASNTAALGNVAPYYHDYSAQQPGTLAIPNMLVSRTTNVMVALGPDANQYSALWIDFNHNGVFDNAEYFTLSTNAGVNGTATIPVAIPATALLGQTKLRIRGGDDSVPLAANACGTSQSDYGEAEDYLVNLTTPTASRTGQNAVVLHAFPNPATAVLTVQVGSATPQAQVTLTDLAGRVLQIAPVTNQTASFNLSSLAAGIYLVRYQDASTTSTIKVSKQ